jgi:hypothetical protein
MVHLPARHQFIELVLGPALDRLQVIGAGHYSHVPQRSENPPPIWKQECVPYIEKNDFQFRLHSSKEVAADLLLNCIPPTHQHDTKLPVGIEAQVNPYPGAACRYFNSRAPSLLLTSTREKM